MSEIVINWADPCVAAEQVRVAYYECLSGRRVTVSEFEQGTGHRRRVHFQEVNASAILETLRRLEAECAAKQGKSPRRAYI